MINLPYYLGIVEEAVEDLPEKDDGHEDEVDSAQDEYVGPEGVGELLPLGHPLVVLPQVPLVEGGPGRLEEDQLQVELEAGGEEDGVPQHWQVVPQGQEGLVGDGATGRREQGRVLQGGKVTREVTQIRSE